MTRGISRNSGTKQATPTRTPGLEQFTAALSEASKAAARCEQALAAATRPPAEVRRWIRAMLVLGATAMLVCGAALALLLLSLQARAV